MLPSKSLSFSIATPVKEEHREGRSGCPARRGIARPRTTRELHAASAGAIRCSAGLAARWAGATGWQDTRALPYSSSLGAVPFSRPVKPLLRSIAPCRQRMRCCCSALRLSPIFPSQFPVFPLARFSAAADPAQSLRFQTRWYVVAVLGAVVLATACAGGGTFPNRSTLAFNKARLFCKGIAIALFIEVFKQVSKFSSINKQHEATSTQYFCSLMQTRNGGDYPIAHSSNKINLVSLFKIKAK